MDTIRRKKGEGRRKVLKHFWAEKNLNWKQKRGIGNLEQKKKQYQEIIK